MKLSVLLVFLSSLVGAVFAQPAPSAGIPDTAYLFSYFIDNGQDGLRLAWSRDGLKWESLNAGRSYLRPTVGKSRLMRDPCVVQGPDGVFHMVWTDSWDSRTIGYASTRDFRTWSPQKELAVMKHEPTTKNCWAPEIVYDAARQQFLIFWASTIPGRFPATEFGGRNDNNHRIYATTTRDFETFTPTTLFFDPGFNVIDSTLLALNGKSYMISKDETKAPSAMKNLRLAVSDDIAGPYIVEAAPINRPDSWVEGPSALQIGDTTYLYFDAYRQHHYAALRSKDLKTWEDVTSRLSMPRGARHGTAFAVSGDVIRGLLSPAGTQAPATPAPAPTASTPPVSAPQSASTGWRNPLIPRRADPHVTLHSDGFYYFTATVPEYDRIELRRARSIGELAQAGAKTIWRKHASGPMGAHIWAPEIHFIDGKWYIYFAAGETNAIWNIRMYVLENASANPLEGEWTEKGKIQMPWESFTLDATTFVHRGVRYLSWAQSLPDIRGTSIFLAKMDTPWSITGQPVMITKPDLPWERIGHNVNEAPAVIARNGRLFMSYSASATDANYCLGLLTADENADLLEPASWKKSPAPVFKSDAAAGQFGPGHNCFTTTPDGRTDLLVYHARNYEKIQGDPLRNPDRATRVQVLGWNADGTPDFGVPVADGVAGQPARPADPALVIEAAAPVGKVSPLHYGLMTEEINYSYDGGLYAELVRNRAFLDDAGKPVHWSPVASTKSAATITLDPAQPLNEAIPTSLRLDVTAASGAAPAGVANAGYWGIPIKPATVYRASLHAKAAPGFSGPLTIALVSNDGATVYATGKISKLTAGWKAYEVELKTDKKAPVTAEARLQLTVAKPGTVWLGLVSLFPPTWKNRPNGLRPDIMQMLVDLKPGFLRFPGGNYLEGDVPETRFEWKKTLGPIEGRPGHPGPWGYRSTDGMGLMEFLLWCEDMGAEPVLGLYAGYSLKGAYIKPGPDLEPYLQEALEEIEYVIGPVTSPWGARRAKDGHPEPFKLRYVEIGNEDWFDKSGSYDGRFTQFYDAIKKRYPHLKCISSVGNEQPAKLRVHSRQPDVLDEHYYRKAADFLKDSPRHFDRYDRKGPEIFVGEWAAHETGFPPWDKRSKQEAPTPNMLAALGDAAFMVAMERNSDLVTMQCYAPIFANVNEYQWRPNLMGYDALQAFGSPSYHALRLFSNNVGDSILKTTLQDAPGLHATATHDSRNRTIIVKIVNPLETAQKLRFELRGARAVSPKARVEVLSAPPTATNSISAPRQVVPVIRELLGLEPAFIYSVAPHSITVLTIREQ